MLKVSVPVHVLHHSVHAATDLSLRVALADEPRPLAVLPALVILRAAAAAEQRAHPRHVSRVSGHVCTGVIWNVYNFIHARQQRISHLRSLQLVDFLFSVDN